MSNLQNPVSASSFLVAVIMERKVLTNRWISEMWEVKGVVPDGAPSGTPRSVIVREHASTQILFPGHVIRLQRGEAEGFYLNITSHQPKVFVLWRMQDEVAQPVMLSVSYNEGTRWADSGESVDGVPMPAALLPWIGEFVEQHYRPEPHKQKRYASNKDKGRMGGV